MTDSMTTTSDTEEEARDEDHLEDIDDGCGCAEVWEHLSERRGSEDDD
jgi:hypothetical protein